MDQELTTDGALLMAALPPATRQKALQVRQAAAQAGKGPGALHQQAQGLDRERRHGPTTHRRRALNWLVGDSGASRLRARPLLLCLGEDLPGVLRCRLL